jgi:hypothetical protein
MKLIGDVHPPAVLVPGKHVPDVHWICGWADPTAGLDTLFKINILICLLEIEPQFFGHLARSQSLYSMYYRYCPSTLC